MMMVKPGSSRLCHPERLADQYVEAYRSGCVPMPFDKWYSASGYETTQDGQLVR